MKEMAIKCGVDNLGRVTLPIQYRRALNINAKDGVNVVFKNNGLFIFKEDEKNVLKRKIEDIMGVVNECNMLNDNERDKLGKLLAKLV